MPDNGFDGCVDELEQIIEVGGLFYFAELASKVRSACLRTTFFGLR
jgi:hypothetical protein